MPIAKLPAPASIRIEIEVSYTLLQALEKKLPGDASLSNDERFEIAVLKFMAARALCLNKRARAS
jgi:hypothetical protein